MTITQFDITASSSTSNFMKWKKLLSNKRFAQRSVKPIRSSASSRSDFEADFDRILFSTAFRNLQDKTQVIPLPDETFVHNRLTHSLEVSSVGKTLGREVGEKIIEKYPELLEQNIQAIDFGNIVASASLCHDIGNPPFGHSGEKAFSEYFINGAGKRFKDQLSEQEWNDLIDFEGNANGFHLLNNYAGSIEGGLRLTYATLAAFIKYPRYSGNTNKTDRIWHKKYGIFEIERSFYEEIALETGISNHRHPLAYLMEAADDICYSLIDFEDGIRLGLIDFSKAEDLFKDLVSDWFNNDKYTEIKSQDEKIGYLRALAIGKLINDCVSVFIDNENDITNGNFNKSLIKCLPNQDIIKEIKRISIEKVYQSKAVLEREAMGFEVISFLLNEFTTTIDEDGFKSKKLQQLIPKEYLPKEASTYHKLIRICEYLAFMSDRKALSIYRKLRGLS